MAGNNSIRGDETVTFTDNMSFDGTERGGKMTVNGQLWIGATALPHVKLGALTSPLGTISIGYASPNITLDLAGGSVGIDSIAVDTTVGAGTNPVLPTPSGQVSILGGQFPSGTFGTRTVATVGSALNTMQVSVQISSAQAVIDTAKNGISHFKSTDFAVDPVGFVSFNTTGVVKTITGQTGGALAPASNNFNIFGAAGVTTSGSGFTLTINGPAFTDSAAAALLANNGYFATAAGTYSLPATALQGDLIILVSNVAGAVTISAPVLNFIRLGSSITAAGGVITSTAIGDSVTLRYRLAALTWEATSIIGNWTII